MSSLEFLLAIKDAPSFIFKAAHLLFDHLCHECFGELVHIDILKCPEIQEMDQFSQILMTLYPVPDPVNC
jgi:hypothetical protein